MLLQRALFAMPLVAVSVIGATPVAGAAPPANDPVQVLAINDFHGRISPTTGAESRLTTDPGPDGVFGSGAEGDSDDVATQVGGAAYMAAVVQERQAAFRREAGGSAASFFVAAGDLITQSPPESAAYKDEPTIEVLNAMGLDVSAAGNHEFDRGMPELRRLSAATDGLYTDDVTACQGVTPGVDGCFGEGEHAFTGADFPYLAANVLSTETGGPVLPPYEVLYTPGGVRLALIGVVKEETVPEGAGAMAGIEFIDEAAAVNQWIPELKSQGIEAIGVLLHAGGQRPAGDINGCDSLDGPVLGINERIDPAVDFIVSADTHEAYNCLLPVPGAEPRLVTQAGVHGQVVTDLRLTLDRRTGDVDRTATYTATNVPVERTASDERVKAIVDYWVAGPANQVPAEVPVDPPSAAVTEDGALGDNRETAGLVILGAIALVASAVAVRLQIRRNRRRRARGSYGYGYGAGPGPDPGRPVRTPPRGKPHDAPI